jgi:hypothetical protein
MKSSRSWNLQNYIRIALESRLPFLVNLSTVFFIFYFVSDFSGTPIGRQASMNLDLAYIAYSDGQNDRKFEMKIKIECQNIISNKNAA